MVYGVRAQRLEWRAVEDIGYCSCTNNAAKTIPPGSCAQDKRQTDTDRLRGRSRRRQVGEARCADRSGSSLRMSDVPDELARGVARLAQVQGKGQKSTLLSPALLASLAMSLLPPQGMPWVERLGRGAIRVRVSASSAVILWSPPGQFLLDNPADWRDNHRKPNLSPQAMRHSHCGDCS
jgi:hypothetical protein